ncbi:hypothetical protein EON65_28650 [archaeon]|nr:MAG: hypothetical protein EON65_28650 [archaeon]
MKSAHLGGLLLCVSIVNLTLAVLPYWVHVDSYSDIGVFTSLRSGSQMLITTQCDYAMEEIECGYVKAMQICTVVTILFGFCGAVVYFSPPRSFNNLQTFLAQVCSSCSFVFALMNTVLLAYFKVDYFDDDGINREDDDIGASNVHYEFCYWLWVATTVATFLIMTTGYFYIYRVRYMKNIL